jgi:hypothetical protein
MPDISFLNRAAEEKLIIEEAVGRTRQTMSRLRKNGILEDNIG